MMHWGTYGWGMGFGWLGMVVVWALIIGCIVYAAGRISGGTVLPAYRERPLDVLKKRYAGGELSRQEFDRLREDLKKS